MRKQEGNLGSGCQIPGFSVNFLTLDFGHWTKIICGLCVSKFFVGGRGLKKGAVKTAPFEETEKARSYLFLKIR